MKRAWIVPVLVATALGTDSCARGNGAAYRIEVDTTFVNVPSTWLPAGAWSPDGRAFVVGTRGGPLAIGAADGVPKAPRRVVERRVTDHVWSPSGARLACRAEARRTLIGLRTYDVIVVEHDTLTSTILLDGDVWGLVWLSDTSLWARRGQDGTLSRLASFATDPGRPHVPSSPTTTGFNVILPPMPRWRPVPTLLVGPVESMPPGSTEIPGAPGFAQRELPTGTEFYCESSNARTRKFLGWQRQAGDVLLDSSGAFERRVLRGPRRAFEAHAFSGDGSVILGRGFDDSQVGPRPRPPMAVAADGSEAPIRVEGPPFTMLRVSALGDRVLLATGRGISLGRLVRR